MLNIFRPRHIVRRYDELDCESLLQRGLRGVMIDLDNTLVQWPGTEIDPGALAWVQCLQSNGIQVCLVTNALKTRRAQPVANFLGMPWVKNALKPLGSGFRRGLNILGTSPAQTAMVGDQVFTDIYGGNLLGLYTVLVAPLGNEDALLTKLLQRPLERLMLRRSLP